MWFNRQKNKNSLKFSLNSYFLQLCVFITFFVRGDKKIWSNLFVLALALIDFLIGILVLPLRFYRNDKKSISSTLCLILKIADSWAFSASVYTVLLMTLLYVCTWKSTLKNIRCLYIILLIATLWIHLLLLYTIPILAESQNLLKTAQSTQNDGTVYCATFLDSISRPSLMFYFEVGLLYTIPCLFISFELIYLMELIFKQKNRQNQINTRQPYRQHRSMHKHVFFIGLVFILFWLPWATLRTLHGFNLMNQNRSGVKIAYYIFMLKSIISPIVYASTNSSFRFSFAVYRHKRVIPIHSIMKHEQQVRS